MTDDIAIVPQKNSRATTWRWVAMVLAISQLAAPPIIMRVFGDFLSSGATNEALITPSGYAFGIWGLITLLCAVTCAAVLWKGLGAAWEVRLLADASVVFVGFSTWLVVAAQDWLWLSVVVFAIMGAALVDAVRLLVYRADELTCPVWLRQLATVTFGLYLGWASVAVFANIAAALIDSGSEATEIAWQAMILVAAAAAAIVLTVTLRATPGYVAAVLWALVAVAVGASHRGSAVLAGASVAAAVVVAAAAGYVVIRRRRPRT